ncbi:MAG: IS110 family transposase [Clostridiales bacterium]|nr:IS110 family transposase [Clostridiales bacterium]
MKVYVGIDAHTTNYTLAAMFAIDQDPINVNTYAPKISNIVSYCKDLKKRFGEDTEIITGYEAGTLGFSLRRDLEEKNIKCIVVAPSSIPGTEMNRKRRKKTDKRDAKAIAKSLLSHDYSEVHMPDKEDEAVRDYIRLREDIKQDQKRTKQRIGAFCHRHGFHYSESKYWTKKHMEWLRSLPVEGMLKETLDGYLRSLNYHTDRINELDIKINTIAETDKYRESVHKLICFKGIKTLTALALIVEIGDFTRFVKAKNFAAFLGLVSGENSSSDGQNLLGITKQGNRFLRRLLTESAQCFSRFASRTKSKELLQRQSGNTEEIIAYADKANERLRKRYQRLVLINKKPANKANTAVARELACFIWGMMTGNTHTALA